MPLAGPLISVSSIRFFFYYDILRGTSPFPSPCELFTASFSIVAGWTLTYGAYVDKRQSLGAATLAIGAGVLIYAFIAGPSLVFMALPAAFSAMPLGAFFGGLFFVLLAIAALTSAVSLLEVPVSFAMDRWG